LDFADEDEKRAIQFRFLAEHVVPMMTGDFSEEQNTEAEGEEYYGLSEVGSKPVLSQRVQMAVWMRRSLDDSHRRLPKSYTTS
jgi:hypothetical protein